MYMHGSILNSQAMMAGAGKACASDDAAASRICLQVVRDELRQSEQQTRECDAIRRRAVTEKAQALLDLTGTTAVLRAELSQCDLEQQQRTATETRLRALLSSATATAERAEATVRTAEGQLAVLRERADAAEAATNAAEARAMAAEARVESERTAVRTECEAAYRAQLQVELRAANATAQKQAQKELAAAREQAQRELDAARGAIEEDAERRLDARLAEAQQQLDAQQAQLRETASRAVEELDKGMDAAWTVAEEHERAKEVALARVAELEGLLAAIDASEDGAG